MQFYLETERLILRDLLETDVDGIFELDSDPLVHKYLGKNPIATKAQAEESIEFIRYYSLSSFCSLSSVSLLMLLSSFSFSLSVAAKTSGCYRRSGCRPQQTTSQRGNSDSIRRRL